MPGSGVNVSLRQVKKLKVKAGAEALLATSRQAMISLLPPFYTPARAQPTITHPETSGKGQSRLF